MRKAWVLLMCLVLLAGCGGTKPAADPEIEAAKKELQEYTQRLVSFDVEPAEQAARIGETVTFRITIRNEGEQPINGVRLITDGPWVYILDRTFSPNAEYKSGLFFKAIEVPNEIPPGEELTVTISGTLGNIKIEAEGHEFGFAPSRTLDDKEFIGDTDFKKVRLYALPKKE